MEFTYSTVHAFREKKMFTTDVLSHLPNPENEIDPRELEIDEFEILAVEKLPASD